MERFNMTSRNIAHLRLAHQQIIDADSSSPEELVGWLGCVQAQDFAQAKWAIGVRMNNITEAAIDKAFDEGRILRTHILRPTWHFVLPDDIGWMLRLTAPRIRAFLKGLHRRLDIDELILKRSRNVIVKALAGGKQLTREQLLQVLKKGRINTDDIRINFLLMDVELDGVICSGPRQGKQFTYMLMEERVPRIEYLDKEAAVAAIAHRYFMSRGPATLQDLCWWSGLSVADAKKGIEMNKKHLTSEVANGQAYWFSNDIAPSGRPSPTRPFPPAKPPSPTKPPSSVHLLPAFDEYTVSYKDRSDVLQQAHHKQSGNGIFKPTIIINGQVAGNWKRTVNKEGVQIELQPFTELTPTSRRLINKAAEKYARFVGKPLVSLI